MAKEIAVRLVGMKPILFDRYPGNKTTKLSPEDKMYLRKGSNIIYLPALNIMSALASDSPNSASKLVYGKLANKIKIGVQAFTRIKEDKIDFLDDKGNQIVFTGFGEEADSQFTVLFHVAKVKKAGLSIPSEKERPCLNLPWELRFTIEYNDNDYVKISDLKQLLNQACIMGMGTFRPTFGGCRLENFEVIK